MSLIYSFLPSNFLIVVKQQLIKAKPYNIPVQSLLGFVDS